MENRSIVKKPVIMFRDIFLCLSNLFCTAYECFACCFLQRCSSPYIVVCLLWFMFIGRCNVYNFCMYTTRSCNKKKVSPEQSDFFALSGLIYILGGSKGTFHFYYLRHQGSFTCLYPPVSTACPFCRPCRMWVLAFSYLKERLFANVSL